MIKALVIGMTPGPAQCLSEIVTGLRDISDVLVLTSNDSRYGGGADVFRKDNIAHVLVESLFPGVSVSYFPPMLAETLINQIRPDVILAGVTPDPTGEKQFTEEVFFSKGESYGIQCLQLIDGWESFYPRKQPTHSSRIFLVFDEYACYFLQSEGVVKENIVITGFPKHLNLNRIDPKRRSLIRRQLGVPNGCRLNVYFGQVRTDDTLTLGWLAKCTGVGDMIVFRKHPRDQRALCELFKLCDRTI